MIDAVFYLLTFLIIFFAFLVVTVRNLLHAALALIACLFFTAGLYILLHAEFVAVAQVLVYVGGVVILIVYTIFLTTRLGERFSRPLLFNKAIAFLVVVEMVVFIIYLYRKLPYVVAETAAGGTVRLREVGIRFLDTGPDGFIVPFEIVSVLLLAVLIGAVTIARKEEIDRVEKEDTS